MKFWVVSLFSYLKKEALIISINVHKIKETEYVLFLFFPSIFRLYLIFIRKLTINCIFAHIIFLFFIILMSYRGNDLYNFIYKFIFIKINRLVWIKVFIGSLELFIAFIFFLFLFLIFLDLECFFRIIIVSSWTNWG